jgi:uncharacterized membrane protein
VRPRLRAIDWLRGLVMVLMALDHTRDFFSNAKADLHTPAGLLAQGDAALFLTRWVTHFCAPVFVFLAGVAAYLARLGGDTRPQAARFLLVRGLWLVLLELTLVDFGWTFGVDGDFVLQVIWAIGWSMVVLAGLVWLPRWLIAIVGLTLVSGHNLLEGIDSATLGPVGWLWTLLHDGGAITPASDLHLHVAYPLLPWLGTMAAGYAFAPVFLEAPARRRRFLLWTGAGLALLFVLLRALDLYGDPRPWLVHEDPLWTVFDFVNCEKYPPSLLYLLMTLGPALLLLGWLDGRRPPLERFFTTLGRVPLFFYLLHLPLIHGLAALAAVVRHGPQALGFAPGDLPDDHGFSLPVVYLVWLVVVGLLFVPCTRFADLKRRRPDHWLRFF